MRHDTRRTLFSCGLGVLLAGLALLGGCKGRNEPQAVAATTDAWPALINEWIESDLKADPLGAVSQV